MSDIAKMIKQTTAGVHPSLQKQGCLFFVYLATIKADWTVQQVNEVFNAALQKGIVESNSRIKSADDLLKLAAQMAGLKSGIRHRGRKYTAPGAGTNFGIADKSDPAVRFIILKYATRWGSHFRMITPNGVWYDPDPKVPVLSKEHNREDYVG